MSSRKSQGKFFGKCIDLNKNENTASQNSWDIAKAVIKLNL